MNPSSFFLPAESSQPFSRNLRTVQIPLTQGFEATVSEEDEPFVVGHKWHAIRHKNTTYAARWLGGRSVYLHRILMNVVDRGREVFVDHINFNGLDNTRGNLRVVTPAENCRNTRQRADQARYPGVYKWRSAWVARFDFDGKDVYLGSFLTEREASIACRAAHKALALVRGGA